MLAPPTDDPFSAMTKQTLFVESRSTHVVTLFVSVATTSTRKERRGSETNLVTTPYRINVELCLTGDGIFYPSLNFIVSC